MFIYINKFNGYALYLRTSTICLVLILCFSGTAVYAQQSYTIQGTVIDAQTQEAIPGVNIVIKDTAIGTTTDSEGNYSLSVPSLNETLVFTYIGYQRQEVPIGGENEIDVELLMEIHALGDDLIVVGYGTQRVENITGAVGSVRAVDFTNQAELQASSALMGKLPGVTVVQNSGQPGQNQGTIRIRGIGTLGNSNPLILIDGVQGSMEDIPAHDIESVSVLKDAASAAIYGSRAANGVILITTKRGTQDIEVNYNGRFGVQQSTNQPRYPDGYDHMVFENMANVNIGNPPPHSQEFMDNWLANHQTDPDRYPNTDWVDLLFSETAYQHQHNLSISGGVTDRVRYRGSLSYDTQDGEIQNFQYDRYSIRLNTDVTVSERFSFLVDLNALRADRESPSFGLEQLTRQAYRLSPILNAINTDGTFGDGQAINPIAKARAGGTQNSETSVFRGRFQAEFTPNPYWLIRTTYSPEYVSEFDRNMRKQFQTYRQGELVGIRPGVNFLSQQYNRSFTNNLDLTVTYRQDFQEHHMQVLGGYEFINFRNDYFTAFRDDFPLQEFEVLNAASPVNQQNTGSASDWAIQSYFGRINYHFMDRYLFEANLRYDGSSRFTDDNRWGLFPSFSVGWRISNEPFMQPVDFISELRVRGSWGQLGNQLIGTYPFAAVVNFGQNFIFGESVAGGAAQLALANPNITWEQTTTTNIGANLGLLEDRVGITFDWFVRETEDILLQLPVPLIIGMIAPTQNAGAVENRGWEFDLSYNDHIGTDFGYSLSFNVAKIRNKVTDLRGAGPFIDGNFIIKEGYPINSIYGFKSDGLFQTQAEIDSHPAQFGDVAPGDIRYVDLNGDGVINGEDRTIIGNPFPDLNLGINLGANYRGFDMSAFFQGARRDVLIRGDLGWAFQNAGKISQWQAEDFWTPDNPDATYPRLTATTSHNNFNVSDFWVFDGTYMRLRNLQVGYTLPLNLVDRMAVRNIRVYFAGQNLFTLDRMPQGIDPNVPNDTSGQIYPIQRVLTFGVDINF